MTNLSGINFPKALRNSKGPISWMEIFLWETEKFKEKNLKTTIRFLCFAMVKEKKSGTNCRHTDG